MKISYAIPVCNELMELTRLVNFLLTKKSEDDEIVILYDNDKGTKEVEEYLISLHKDTPNVHWFQHPLNKNFAQHKNYLNSCCTGDWIFQIDADEYPDEYLVTLLHNIIQDNPDVEAYWVSRINTVYGITPHHIRQWGWNVDDNGRINFPDRQMRLYKNTPEIRWEGAVHEKLTGYIKYSQLPDNEEYCLYHPKDIKRQERQNSFYDTI